MDKALYTGCTPLYVAPQLDDLEVVKLLVEVGKAHVEASAGGWTPLMTAKSEGHEEIAKYLKERVRRNKQGEREKHEVICVASKFSRYFIVVACLSSVN